MCIRDRLISPTFDTFGSLPAATFGGNGIPNNAVAIATAGTCLLYTSDAADERSSVDLGGRRIIKKKKIN